ncbi:MAG: FAD-dependent oxidoreductase [Prochlorothrix sp.]|nr:FAD-dependent oxidoreductase [Prochlorothrix sp.]
MQRSLPRRHFLQLLTLTAVLTRLASCRASSSRSSAETAGSDRSETILVIGAGMAGISAARQLQEAGYRVTVLEGRDRIGGRVWTSRQWEQVPIDLGASWIHGEQGNPLSAIADTIQAPRQATNSEEWPLYDAQGRLLSDRDWEQIETFEADITDAIAESWDLEEDISVEQAIDRYFEGESLSPGDRKRLAFTAHFLLEQDWATNVDRLSAWYESEGEGFGGEDVLFPQGYGALVEYLAQGLEIRLGETVTAVSYGGEGGVTVTASSGTFEADRVVVTLPIGVLKQGTVQFDPPLPAAKTAAIQALGVGVLNKLCLRFPSVFWQEEADWISHIPETALEFAVWLNLARSTGQPVLMAFNMGRFAQELETRSQEQVVDQAMQTLRRLYGRQVPDPVAVQMTRWFSDPFARCSYSSPVVGITEQTRADLAAPVGDRVFFAGEATSVDYPATVHGAYLSGQASADQILRL